MKELNELVQNKLESMANDGSLDAIVNKAIEGMLTSVIEEQFSRCSDLYESLEESLKKGLNVDFDDIDYSTYNNVMLKGVKAHLDTFYANEANNLLAEQIESILGIPPKTMTVTELLDGILKTAESCSMYDSVERVDVSFEQNISDNKYFNLKVSIQKGYLNSPTEIVDLLLLDNNAETGSAEIRLNFQHHVFNPTVTAGLEAGVDAYIFSLYAAKTIITGLNDFDADDYEVNVEFDAH